MSDGDDTMKSAPELWRTLAERAGVLAPAGPGDDGEAGHESLAGDGGTSRRDFLRLMGASLALAGATGCSRRPSERILPYTVQPDEITPGIPTVFATSMVLDGYATGLLVRTHEGRPGKIEGNPEHPASLGAAGVIEQASVLGLYDPHRAQHGRYRARPAAWAQLTQRLAQPRSDGGAGLRVLLPPTASPLVGRLLEGVRRRHPAARLTFHAPLVTDQAREGARLVYGRPLQSQRDLGAADVLLVLDDDLLAAGPMHLANARRFADGRRVARPGAPMNRLYVVEAMLTPTGSVADHRLRRAPSQVGQVAALVAAALVGARRLAVPSALRAALAAVRADAATMTWVSAVADDLVRSAPRSLVVAGERQPPVVHALVHLANEALGAVAAGASGGAVWHTEPTLLPGDAGGAQPLAALAGDLARGAVDTLVILEGNPVHDAPRELELGAKVRRVSTSVYLGLHENETARAATWFTPATHFLESWGDARAADGTASIVQPVIAPLYGGHAAIELLAVLAGEARTDAHSLVRRSWAARGLDEGAWERALRRGLVDGSAAPRVTAAPRWDALAGALRSLPAAAPPATLSPSPSLELNFVPDAAIHDGSFVGNAWLLELPRPITKLSWDNAALLSPGTATRLGVSDEQLVEIGAPGAGAATVTLPALIVPGHADDVVTLPLGFGRTDAGPLASDVGVDVYPLRSAAAPWFVTGATLRVLRGRRALARTQQHHSLESRAPDIALAVTAHAYRREPDFTRALQVRPPSLLPVVPPGIAPPIVPSADAQWAMAIDLGVCTGCSACVVACQAENNVPVVGKPEVLRGREMHWLRIDTYYRGTPDEPRPIHQPMLCQHCEKAPCEYVCPVNATTHSPDGLNEMTYNRCVGTRFCSNNCPYKVRRFNWFDYARTLAPNRDGPVELQRNPEVTVRARGVMEKCTYCVQRVRRAEITARAAGRPVDGELVETACQQACPTRAITFGSLTREDSDVVRWRAQPRSYNVLHHVGAQPRTRYLARVENPNPELARDGTVPG